MLISSLSCYIIILAERIIAFIDTFEYASVVDKSKELEFEYDNRPTIFVDMESGEKIRLQPKQIQSFYVEQVAKFTDLMKARCLQYKIDFVECDINAGFKDILQTYLVKRSKMNA